MSSRICACTVTSRAVVGSSATSTCGRHASAMAIITRCRMPPDSWCGYSSSRRAASGMRTLSSMSSAARPRLGSRYRAVQAHRLGKLVADAQRRIERAHRVLEDHRDGLAADMRQLPLAQSEQRLAVELEPRRGDPCRPRRQQAEQRQGRHALARSALADEAQRLAGIEREGHLARRPQRVGFLPERHAEVFDAQHCLVGHSVAPRRRRGSSVSRSPSPRMLMVSTSTDRKMPGNRIIHGLT